MPRIARVVAVGYPHHITQRGNYRQNIFDDDTDRRTYLSLLQKESRHYQLKILAYCLMTNHIHCIAIPEEEDSMGNVFKYVNMKYSQYFNRKKRESGHLFQGRFFSCVMDEQYTISCARYIERNPVRAKIVERPWEYEWSSASIHSGLKTNDPLGVADFFDCVGNEHLTWKDFIKQPDSPDEINQIREQTRKGRPLASFAIVKKIEKNINRTLALKPRGRPKKIRK